MKTGAGPQTSLLEYLHGCPVCLSVQLHDYCRVPSLFNEGEFIRYDRCGGCGTVLRNPRLPASARLERYEDKPLPSHAHALDEKSQAHYAYMMRVIDSCRPAGVGRSLLDFGCGAGGFLIEARAAGFEVMGLELNRALARHVEAEHGIPVHQGSVSDPALSGEQFDVIVSSQVFEHLLDPRGTLLELRDHLVPSGLLLIEVPNLTDTRESLHRGSLMDDSHLFYFSPSSLARMLREHGFEVVRVEDGIRPYRWHASAARNAPLAALRAAERTLSALRLRTSLSVLARLA